MTVQLLPTPGNLSDYLQIWTVYEWPDDYPDGYVARLFLVGKDRNGPTTQAFYGPTLQSVRDQLPPGLARLPREPNDEAQIVEVWL